MILSKSQINELQKNWSMNASHLALVPNEMDMDDVLDTLDVLFCIFEAANLYQRFHSSYARKKLKGAIAATGA